MSGNFMETAIGSATVDVLAVRWWRWLTAWMRRVLKHRKKLLLWGGEATTWFYYKFIIKKKEEEKEPIAHKTNTQIHE